MLCKARSGFLNESKIKKGGSSVQVEVSGEVDEHVEKPLRCTHVLREDGGKATIESRSDQNRGQPCARRSVLRACWREARTKRRDEGLEFPDIGCGRFKTMRLTTMYVIGVINVSSYSDVIPWFRRLILLRWFIY